MPRDGSNIYHRPAGTDAVADTTIESSKYNANVADVEQDLNTPRPIVAGGTGANSAAGAMANLGGETAKQVITNFDSAVFLPGSFYAATSATNPPVAAHAFAGIAYYNNASDLTVEARDLTDAAHLVYTRIMSAGVWGAWVAVDKAYADTKVAKAGDTMTGNLTLTAPALITATAKGHQLGAAGGTAFNGALTPADANVLGYNAGSGNWAGWGTDNGGNLWIRTGASGTGPAALAVLGDGLTTSVNKISGAGAATFSSTLTVSGAITATAKGHQFGSAAGTVATSPPTLADANIVLYNNGATNWAGLGSDSAGNVWVKAGTSGTPLPAFWLSATTGQATHNGNVTVAGSVTPSLQFAPVSGATKNAALAQNADLFYVQSAGVNNWISVNLNNGITSILTGSGAGLQIPNTAVVIGDTAVSSLERLKVKYLQASQYGIWSEDPTGGGPTSYHLIVARSGVGASGSITTTNSTTTQFNTTSDERMKEFKGAYDPIDAARVIKADPVRNFAWKNTGEDAIGWGAQYSYSVSPDLATPPPDAPMVNAEGERMPEMMWGMDYSKRTPYLWAAVSDLLDRIAVLEAKLAAMPT